MAHITRTDLNKYLAGTTLKDLYETIYGYLLQEEDTLSDEFQILLALESVFWKYAEGIGVRHYRTEREE